MKTAKEYLYAVMGCEPVNARIDYTDALEAVQTALDDAATIRQQVRQGIADYFGDIMPLPPLSDLLAETAPIRLGEKFFQSQPCYRCGKPVNTCGCEQPPF